MGLEGYAKGLRFTIFRAFFCYFRLFIGLRRLHCFLSGFAGFVTAAFYRASPALIRL
jgi:hypothetical protein